VVHDPAGREWIVSVNVANRKTRSDNDLRNLADEIGWTPRGCLGALWYITGLGNWLLWWRHDFQHEDSWLLTAEAEDGTRKMWWTPAVSREEAVRDLVALERHIGAGRPLNAFAREGRHAPPDPVT
jgi:hypothetical protein